MNKRYTVVQARERLSTVLDEAEQGVPVIIERRGVRYQISVVRPANRHRRKVGPRIEVLDAAVEEGRWSWTWDADGLTFRSSRKR
jgi:antitoxin (DNA-binding transcriptional repressor) of toxin-antitoxin stability system